MNTEQIVGGCAVHGVAYYETLKNYGRIMSMPRRVTGYRCRFKYRGQDLSVLSERGVKAFNEGFWLNEDFKLVEYVFGAEEASFICHIWIPPSKIEYIVCEREV